LLAVATCGGGIAIRVIAVEQSVSIVVTTIPTILFGRRGGGSAIYFTVIYGFRPLAHAVATAIVDHAVRTARFVLFRVADTVGLPFEALRLIFAVYRFADAFVGASVAILALVTVSIAIALVTGIRFLVAGASCLAGVTAAYTICLPITLAALLLSVAKLPIIADNGFAFLADVVDTGLQTVAINPVAAILINSAEFGV
jgi:hypothetical protein